jgi:hypothetical protein
MHSLSLLSLALSTALLFGCDGSDTPGAGTTYGTPAALGDGTARSFVRLDANGAPEAVGVVLSEDALAGLPTDTSAGHTMLNLAIPAADGLPYAFVSVGWNPNGHEPEGLFTVPHFDFHFYTESEAEVMSWMPGMPGWETAAQQPEARYIPQGFIADPSGHIVPMMGLHWLDASDATYAPGGPGFTEVFLFGSYGGDLVFAEPMITKAFLETHPNHSETIAQPAAYAADGYYPTRYSVRWDGASRAYVITLEGLGHRTAG